MMRMYALYVRYDERVLCFLLMMTMCGFDDVDDAVLLMF